MELVALTGCLLGLGIGRLATWTNMLGFGHTPGRKLVLPSARSLGLRWKLMATA